MDKKTRWLPLFVILVLLISFFVRISNLSTVPTGTAFDATYNLAESLRISKGISFPLAFTDRPEPLHRFLLGSWFAVAGASFFTARLFQSLVALLTIALAYRAGRAIWRHESTAWLAALVCAGTLAAMTPHLFVSRTAYRAVLTPPVVLLTIILLLRAVRTARRRDWLLGGFVAGLNVYTYLAGIAAIPWLIGYLCHQSILQKGRRLRWQYLGMVAVGLSISLTPWLLLIWQVPDLFFRATSVSAVDTTTTALPGIIQVVDSVGDVLRAYMVDGFGGFNAFLYNVPGVPYVNPLLSLCIVIGLLAALRKWRQAESALVLGGLVVFLFPAIFSQDPAHPLRLIGTMPFVALLAGWGTRSLASYAARTRLSPLKQPFVWRVGIVAVLMVSLLISHTTFQTMFADPANYDWDEATTNISHDYLVSYHDALAVLRDVDQPTYVPLNVIDDPLAYFMLQAEAYPHVTTWPRATLEELPAGQVFYPERGFYNLFFPESYPLQVLLLPDEGTIVILPGNDNQPVIDRPAANTARPVINNRGWVVAVVGPRPAPDLPSPTPASVGTLPMMGNGLVLTNSPETVLLEPGQAHQILIEWLVTAPQEAAVFSVTHLFTSDHQAIARGTYTHILEYLFPSPLWQPGDLIPNLHVIAMPENMPEDLYRWGTGVFLPPGKQPVQIVHSGGMNPIDEFWLWGSGRTSAPQAGDIPADLIPVDASLGGDIRLLGYRVRPGDTRQIIQLYWMTSALPQEAYTVFLHAMRGDHMVGQLDEQPDGGRSPTWSWWPEVIYTTEHTITTTERPDTIFLGMYAYPSLDRLEVTQDGPAVESNRVRIPLEWP
jgi:hypothetical protein